MNLEKPKGNQGNSKRSFYTPVWKNVQRLFLKEVASKWRRSARHLIIERYANMTKQRMIQITDKLDRFKDRKLWYFDMQGEIYTYAMKTKRGYMVHRTDIEDTRMFLILKKHAKEVEGTLLD